MTDITKFNRNGAIRDIGDAKSRANFSDSFTTTISYSTGDLIIHDGSLYKFIQDHSAGEWDLEDVEQTTIKNELNNLGDLATLNSINYSDNYITNKPLLGGIEVRPNYIISNNDLEDGVTSITSGILYFYYE